MLQLQQLIFFQKVAESSSMNKASEELFISQPNLSKAIKNLEEELNTKLFERTNKGVRLTDDGYKLYKYVKTIRKQLDMIQNIAHKDIPSSINIAAYSCSVLHEILAQFYNNNEYIEITLQEQRVAKVIDSVASLHSDIGVIEINHVQKKDVNHILESKNLEYNEFANDTWYVHVGKNSPFYNRPVIEMSDLVQSTVIRAPDDYFSNLSYLIEVDGVNFTQFDKAMFINDYSTRLRLLSMTDMISIEPAWNKDIEKELGIRIMPIANCNIEISMGWIKRKKGNLPEKVMELIELLENKFIGYK
ncbi:MAG: LysR family transcriptional regulator [Solirubrobacterales bacterium]